MSETYESLAAQIDDVAAAIYDLQARHALAMDTIAKVRDALRAMTAEPNADVFASAVSLLIMVEDREWNISKPAVPHG